MYLIETPVSSSSKIEYGPKNPRVVEFDIENPNKVSLEAPFTILTSEGEAPELSLNENGAKGKDIPDVYDNLYSAIRVAGFNSTSKKALQVQDSNYTQVFIRSKKSVNFLFEIALDLNLSGFGQTPAKKYCASHPESYAIDGQASDYFYLGRRDMLEGQTVNETVLETNAGAYNYMFSKGGSGGTDYGFRYVTADVHLSETTYRVADDGGTWNAYIFINIAENILSDLGMIGTMRGDKCVWMLCRNCSSSTHPAGTSSVERDSKFYVYQTEYVTASTKYDRDTRTYSGFDDLHFEAFCMDNGWTLNITNLTTKKVYSFTDTHEKDGQPFPENKSPNNGRALIAASYCPVTGTVWNWDSGAALNNVIFDNIEMKKAIVNDGAVDNNIEHYREAHETFALYPGEAYYRDGYSQGGYAASHIFGTHEDNGTYKSGERYVKGSKYLSFSVDYSHE